MSATFQQPIAKKINKASLDSVKVNCSEDGLLWRDSYEGVDGAFTSAESILHQIIIIFISVGSHYKILVLYFITKQPFFHKIPLQNWSQSSCFECQELGIY